MIKNLILSFLPILVLFACATAQETTFQVNKEDKEVVKLLSEFQKRNLMSVQEEKTHWKINRVFMGTITKTSIERLHIKVYKNYPGKSHTKLSVRYIRYESGMFSGRDIEIVEKSKEWEDKIKSFLASSG